MPKKSPPSHPEPGDRVHAVRWTQSRKCLAADPLTTWRWSEPSQALLMTLAEAQHAVARMGGIICVDGVPLDKIGVAAPSKPRPVRGPDRVETKTDRLREHVAAERWQDALRIAIRLRGLREDDQKALERAWIALTKPDFVRETKRDPDVLLSAGISVLRRRWGLV